MTHFLPREELRRTRAHILMGTVIVSNLVSLTYMLGSFRLLDKPGRYFGPPDHL